MNDLLTAISSRPWMPAIISVLVLAGSFFLYAWLLIIGNTAGIDDIILGRILGTFDMAFALVLNYWLGSTKASSDKDKTIANMGGKREEWTPAQRKGTK